MPCSRPSVCLALFSLIAVASCGNAAERVGDDDDDTGGEAGDTSGNTSGGKGGGGPSAQGGAGGKTSSKSGGSGGSEASGGSPSGGGSGGVAQAGGSGGTAEPDAAVADAGAPDTGGEPDPGGPSMAPVPSAACAGGALMPGPNGNQMVQANGKNRTFIIRVPAGYDGKKPFPALFAFHGAGGGASSFETGAFGSVSRMAADKAIRIYPQAYGGNTWSRDEPDDVLFMDALVAWLGPKVCYDTARVYASGQSSGAYFSHRFACDRGTVVRAVATNSGGQRKERALDCKNAVSSWTSTGLGDDPGHVMGTRQARDEWIKLAGCSTKGVPTEPAPCLNYPGCRPGYTVNHCEHGGGHGIPGYAPGGIINFLFGGKN